MHIPKRLERLGDSNESVYHDLSSQGEEVMSGTEQRKASDNPIEYTNAIFILETLGLVHRPNETRLV